MSPSRLSFSTIEENPRDGESKRWRAGQKHSDTGRVNERKTVLPVYTKLVEVVEYYLWMDLNMLAEFTVKCNEKPKDALV